MISIDRHIHKLLFTYDCVIVPGFGGFIANYSPAKIHPVQHSFSPPYKKLSFNKNLNNNDGLLANHISQDENLSFDEAIRAITDFVKECNRLLGSSKKLSINEVGTFTVDVEGNLQFEPEASVNYLSASFGLSEFISPPILRESIEKKIEKKIEKQLKDREPIPIDRKKVRRRVLAAACLLPLLLYFTWVPLKTDFFKTYNYSELNPFAEKIMPDYTSRILKLKPVTESELKAEEGIVLLNDTVIFTKLNFGDPARSIVVRLKEEMMAAKADVDNTKVVGIRRNTNANLPFHVVGGCFTYLENAEKYITMLRQKNITASIIGKNAAGLNIVSCGDYATREEAISALEKVRATSTEAWLLKK